MLYLELDVILDGMCCVLFDCLMWLLGKYFDVSRVIDRLDLSGTYGCRV